MGKLEHGLCRRDIRPALGSIGHPGAGLKGALQRFWKAIALGMPTDDAAIGAGVSSAVGARSFRHAGCVPNVSLEAPSEHYLSFADIEEIALLRAQGHGVGEIAGRAGRSASTISRELCPNAVTRSGSK